MTSGLERFAELVTREQFSLAEACLLIAEDQYPGLDIAACVAKLDAMAATVRGRLAADALAEQKVAALNWHLFGELRFCGNADAYYDPRNSYLNEVLERRTGIPITLSIVYLEVGRRLGLQLQGVSFPGHFLVQLRLKRGQLLLDPFTGGEPCSESELRTRLDQALPSDRRGKLDLDRYLEPAAPREIVARVLRNLKGIYLKRGAFDRALAVMHRMLLVVPESAEELRDRGLVHAELECFRPALADLQNYLRRRPDAADASDIHARVVELREAASRLQ
ncbi:MAG TPA: tetratricopeptide repeat protein [Burkholderiales bacterium]|nr:tetratricopeptide repeat protein [Burkholderiales bacterium]